MTMKTVGIFYATATGKTGRLVDQIVQAWDGAVDRSELVNSKPEDLLRYDNLLLGTPTYGIGQLHHHWPEFLEGLEKIDLSGKRVGLFVMADGRYHGDSFAGALGLLYDSVKARGGTVLGTSDPADFQFAATSSLRDSGLFPGLVIDGSSPAERRKTPQRITDWIAQLKEDDGFQ